jgi:hypothetical protein
MGPIGSVLTGHIILAMCALGAWCIPSILDMLGELMPALDMTVSRDTQAGVLCVFGGLFITLATAGAWRLWKLLGDHNIDFEYVVLIACVLFCVCKEFLI